MYTSRLQLNFLHSIRGAFIHKNRQLQHYHSNMLEKSDNILYRAVERHFDDSSSNLALFLEDERKFFYADLAVYVQRIHDLIYPSVRKATESIQNELAINPASQIVPTPLVAVVMTRDLGVIAAILAILKTGAAYVPVDPTFPPDRQSYIFEQSKCLLLITDEKSYKDAKNLGVELPKTLILHSETAEIVENNLPHVELSNDDVVPYVDPHQQLAYVLYTSGSTGKPKGVMVKQESVLNIIDWFADDIGITQSSRVLGLTTLSFDISVLELFMALTRGATLCLAKSKTQKDPFRLLDFAKRAKINVIQGTPTTYELLLATGWRGDESLDFLVGGEAYRPPLNVITRKCRSFRNVYGPTETTIWSSSYTIPPREDDDVTPLPIGNPISLTDFYIVSTEEGAPPRLMPVGEEGELWIGGIGVAAGYLGRPDLTNDKFIRNPFGSGLVYKTGDIAKELGADKGGFVFGRRMDDQVKLNGYRIELAEIEHVYETEEYIAKAVALVRHDRLVLYVLPQGNIELTKSLIKKANEKARRQLTYYMIPSSVVVVKTFPTTANGKLDRKALPDPPIEIDDNDEVEEVQLDNIHKESLSNNETKDFIHPQHISSGQTIMENHIISIISKTRGQAPKATSSFAAIGIDSLGSIIFLRTLSDSLGGISVSPQLVYAQGMNIRSLAKILLERLTTESPMTLSGMGINLHDEKLARIESDTKAESNDEDEEESNSFDEKILVNRELLEGLRGFFALLVLVDHFHNTRDHFTRAIGANTGLFVVLTGFTSSLQTRSQAVFDPSRTRKFQWQNFLGSRAVGLFPILWLGLLSAAAWWVTQDDRAGHKLSNSEIAARRTCAVLYPIGLQFLYRPQCRNYGPNSMAYGSIIWTNFIAYSIFRVIFVAIQNAIVSFGSKYPSTSSVYMFTELIKDAGVNGKNGLVNPIWLGIFYFIFFQLLFIAVIPLGNGRIYFQLFLGGVGAASYSEVLFNYTKRSLLGAIHPNYSPVEAAKGTPLPPVIPPTFYTIKTGIEIFDNIFKQYPIPIFSKWQDWLYWSLPDAVFITTLVLFSPAGALSSKLSGTALYNTGIPTLYIVYLILVFSQSEKYRTTLSRYIFESWPFTLLGYCSYALYIFQLLFLTQYLHDIVNNIEHHRSLPPPPPGTFGYQYEWFADINDGYKFISIMILIVFCWAVHKYYQDGFATYVYTKYIIPCLTKQNQINQGYDKFGVEMVGAH